MGTPLAFHSPISKRCGVFEVDVSSLIPPLIASYNLGRCSEMPWLTIAQSFSLCVIAALVDHVVTPIVGYTLRQSYLCTAHTIYDITPLHLPIHATSRIQLFSLFSSNGPFLSTTHYLGCGNSSSNFNLTKTFILNNSCTNSFAAYGIVMRVTPFVLLHVWHQP